jgi:hypothetical protein
MNRSKLSSEGSINILLIPFIVVLVFFLGTAGFGAWAYTSRQDYKNNTDEKVATAVDIAKKQTATDKDNEFIDREKLPLKEYAGPSSYGSLKIKYPKTWSAYVEESQSQDTPINAYFNPNFVPSVNVDSSTFALRVQVVSQTFDEVVSQFDSNVAQGTTKAKAYKAENVSGSVGLRFDGELENGKHGTMIVLKLRDKSLKLWTEGDQYTKDFFNHILANLTFEP